MKQKPRIYYTDNQKALMWERWRQGDSLQKIAQLFDRNHSSVIRILAETGGIRPAQRCRSHQRAWDRARRPKPCKLVVNRKLADIVAGKPQFQWSPEQIAGWLKPAYTGDEDFHVSHETIYRSLYIQARGALKKELLEHLRRSRNMRRSRHHTQKTDDHGRINGTVSISERLATAEDRAVPEH